MCQPFGPCWCFVASLALGVGFALLSYSESGKPILPIPLPGGVSEPGGKVGFVLNKSGGIDALDLGSGETLWSSDREGQLLLAWDDRLAVLVRDPGKSARWRVLLLDTGHKGRRLLESEPLPLPAWVVAGSGGAPSFRTSPSVRDQRLRLTWTASEVPQFGVDPLVLPQATGARAASGSMDIDLQSGRVEVLVPASPPKVEKPEIPEGLAKLISRPYREGGRFRSDPLLVVGEALILEKLDSNPSLILKRWNHRNGRELSPVDLGPAGPVAPLVTLDGGHLLVAGKSGEGERPHQRLIALPTGKTLVTLPVGETVSETSVLGGRVYVAVDEPVGPNQIRPRVLRAYALSGGKLLWEHSIQGIRVTPAPPRRP